MTATVPHSTSAAAPRLYVAFELGWSKIKLALSPGPLHKPRLQELPARDLDALRRELAKAKERFGLPADAQVRSCYEAGRDGFWLHRWLTGQDIHNVIVDPGSLRVERRRKRAKTDRLDARLLLDHLFEYHQGKPRVWSVVQVPTLAQEEQRQLHRELEALQGERTEHVNRLKSILATLGLKLPTVLDAGFPAWLAEQRLLETGQLVPADHQARLRREYQRWQLVQEQVVALEAEQQRRVATGSDASTAKVQKLLQLKSVGIKSAWLFSMEFFGWRSFRNRRQVGALAGLTPTPYQSGEMERELGLSKAGNRWIRSLIVEIAWGWLRWQPTSQLSVWFRQRFGAGGGRSRKKGIVALARKLLIALWRWLEFDEVPAGAVLGDWRAKVPGARSVA